MDCSPPGSLSMGFSRQEFWSGLPWPPPGNLPNPEIEPRSPTCRWILYVWSTREAHFALGYRIVSGEQCICIHMHISHTHACIHSPHKPPSPHLHAATKHWAEFPVLYIVGLSGSSILHIAVYTKSDWLYSLQPKMEKLWTVSKNKTRSWVRLRSRTPNCKIQT